MEQVKENKLMTKPIGKLLFSLAVPAIVAQIINMLYNVVDRIYIAQLHNDAALSGLTVCFPILMIVSAFAALIGMGGAPLASIKMGQKNTEEAEKILGNSFISLIGISVILTLVLSFTFSPILTLFGATEQSQGYAESYIFIYILGTLFVQLSLGLNTFITAQGAARVSMITVLIGAVLNIVLDPIFIFGFNMGVQGAALATIIAQFVSALWVIIYLFGKKTLIKIRPKFFKISPKLLLGIVALGVSPFIMQITESLVQLTFNAGLKRYALSVDEATLSVAAMGVIFTVLQMLSMPIMGLAQGAQPIISYNYGARNIERVKRTFKLLFIWAVGISVTVCLAVELFPQIFAMPLSPSKEVMEYAARNMRIFMAGTFMLGVQFSCQNTLVALGQAKVSLFLAIFRKIILLVPLAIILPFITIPHSLGLFLSEPIADIIAATVTGICFIAITTKLYKRVEKKIEEEKAAESQVDTVGEVDMNE